MTSEPLVSIIVPVYNVAKYLEECVASLLNQTYENIEIILVDDGSTDGSGAVCDKLATTDGRIAVYHKTNGGLSDARNYGLERCCGKWVSFVDSDDYVSTIFIQILLEAALNNGCNIAAVPFGLPFKDGSSCELVSDVRSVTAAKPLSSRDIQRLMLYQSLDTGAQWRLYRKDLLESEVFPTGLYYEDLASVYKTIHKVDKVALVDCRALYAYRLRSESIIRQDYRHIKAKSALLISDQLYNDITTWYPELANAAASRCFSVCRMVYAQVPVRVYDGVTIEIRNDANALWAELNKMAPVVLRDPCARKRERLAAGIAYIGREPFTLFCLVCRKAGLLR